MPILFALPVGLSLGAALAWMAAPELTRDDAAIALSRPFVLVVSFALLLWLPVVAYFVAFHGDWSYLYLVSWQRVPSAIDLGLVLASGGMVPLGFALSARLLRKRRLGPVAALVGCPLALAGVGLALAAGRLAVSGSFVEFHGDFGTEPIAASTLGKGVLLMGIVLGLGLVWMVRSLLRMAAEARS